MKRKKRIVKITEEQKVFAKEYVGTGDLKTAAQLAYPNNKSIQNGQQSVAYARRILRSKPVVSEISRLLDRAGVTKNALSRELFNLLHGTEVNGIVVPCKEDTRLKAVRMGFELHGAFEHERIEVEDNATVISEDNPEAKNEIIRDLIARVSAKSGSI